MKIISVFSKAPQHKKFSYTPRFYDAQEEERLEREKRIRRELELQQQKEASDADTTSLQPGELGHRDRIAGSFRMAKKTAAVQSDPSANMLRLIILFVLTLGLIGFMQFGAIALYIVAFLFVPFYFYLKFRNPAKKGK